MAFKSEAKDFIDEVAGPELRKISGTLIVVGLCLAAAGSRLKGWLNR